MYEHLEGIQKSVTIAEPQTKRLKLPSINQHDFIGDCQ